jgi:hypothetical protein
MSLTVSSVLGHARRLRRSGAVLAAGATVLALTAVAVTAQPAGAVQRGAGCAARPASTRAHVGSRVVQFAGFHGATNCGPTGTGDPAIGTPPLINHGGPVMATAANSSTLVVTPIFWAPSGYTFAAAYKNLIVKYLNDVAAASNHRSNVFATNTEYSGSNGQVHYNTTVGATITDTHAFPSSGCTVNSGSIYSDGSGYTECLDDAQIISEVGTEAAALPQDLGHIYVMFTPKHVESCFEAGNPSDQQCTINPTPSAAYCAYHSDFGSSGLSIYANMPFPIYGVANSPTCGSDARFPTEETPNNNADADTEISPLSHEISEATTDPDLNAWYDSSGYENGDECAYVYGTTAGTAGHLYNQTINGDHYITQEEFSNADFNATGGGCIPQAKLVTPHITTVAPKAGPVAGGTVITITGTNLIFVNKVTVGGTAATNVVNINGTQVKATVPAGTAGAASVVAASPDASSNAGTFTYDKKPTVTKVAPTSGTHLGGTTVTITGTNFVTGAKVTFGTSAGTSVTVASATKITVKAPAHAKGKVAVTVSTPGGKSAVTTASHYTYT